MPRFCHFVRTSPHQVTCPDCGRVVNTTHPPERVRAECRASIATTRGLGDLVEAGLTAVGITKRRVAKILGSCGGCDRRQQFLNRLGRVIGLGLPKDAPLARWAGTPYFHTKDLVASALRIASEVATRVDAVVGIPRSGLIPAAVIATRLHLPLFTLRDDGPQPTGSGGRAGFDVSSSPSSFLLIDDSSHNGYALDRALEILRRHDLEPAIAAVCFCTPRATGNWDVVDTVVDTPHLFAWNWPNAPWTEHLACDFDGVLCEDCPPGADCEQNGPAYVAWLERAMPLQLPRKVPLKAIVTAREERFREPTEAWLRRHGVAYRELVMIPRRAGVDLGRWKAEVCDRIKPDIFFESDAAQVDAFNRYSHWTLAVHAPAAPEKET